MAADGAMSERHFCTYFDHRYLARGLALQASLAAHAPGHTLWVLCLSKECEQFLRAAELPGVRLVSLDQLEQWDPELAATRQSRSLVEYYFTCSPCLPRYILHNFSDVPAVTYLDSDLYFFSSPEPVFAEIGECAVAIIPHRFPVDRAADLEKYGRYNVGWLTFSRGPDGLACLDWWRERCIEWCLDRVEPNRFADQKYLDAFETLFHSVHEIRHIGANLAPWNVSNYLLDGSPVTVDGAPLVFFHFQGLKQVYGSVFDTHLDEYQVRLTTTIRNSIYRPYLQALIAASRKVAAMGDLPQRDEHLRGPSAWTGRLKARLSRAFLTASAAVRGDLVLAPPPGAP